MEPDTPDQTPSPAPTDALGIFQLLKRGLGHELVHDGNVADLIAVAREHGHALLEQELREWSAPCSGGSRDGPPSTIAPTRGFDKEHVRH